jgi:hypothetical protein
MSYSAIYADLFRKAAVYVDKILKGAQPADLPVEQPTRFQPGDVPSGCKGKPLRPATSDGDCH